MAGYAPWGHKELDTAEHNTQSTTGFIVLRRLVLASIGQYLKATVEIELCLLERDVLLKSQ